MKTSFILILREVFLFNLMLFKIRSMKKCLLIILGILLGTSSLVYAQDEWEDDDEDFSM